MSKNILIGTIEFTAEIEVVKSDGSCNGCDFDNFCQKVDLPDCARYGESEVPVIFKFIKDEV